MSTLIDIIRATNGLEGTVPTLEDIASSRNNTTSTSSRKEATSSSKTEGSRDLWAFLEMMRTLRPEYVKYMTDLEGTNVTNGSPIREFITKSKNFFDGYRDLNAEQINAKAKEESDYATDRKRMVEADNDYERDRESRLEATEPKVVESEATETDNDVVEYTYKPGDTFGQVLLDIGLSDPSGYNLWGADGDVAYYRQQLLDQGLLDRNGNIPIGTTVKLRKRGSSPKVPMSSWAYNTQTREQSYGPYYSRA